MIEQVKDVYEWYVTCADGSIISEDDREDRLEFAAVSDKQIKEVGIKPRIVEKFPELEELSHHSVLVPEGATPVFFRRRSLEIHVVDGSSHIRSSVHCIGWKREDEAVYLFISENSTLLTDNLQAV